MSEQAISAGIAMLSVIIPVYNEEAGLAYLCERLYPVLDQLALAYEVIFINDGSCDDSAKILTLQHQARPEQTRIIFLQRNYGQHMAIMAGFEHARGDIVVTLDADLQNPPEEIPRLVALIQAGHDYVGSIRKRRDDHWLRCHVSRLGNFIRERITNIRMTDQGCMLRAYAKPIITAIMACDEGHTFIPALAYTFAHNPTEIEVSHESRFAGQSKYSSYQLLRLNFDLITGFSILPLQIFSLFGMLLSLSSAALFAYLLLRRLIFGTEVEGVFTLFAITFFLIGVLLFGIGLLGEYVGRIYQAVRKRPRYLIRAVLLDANSK